MRYDNGVDWVEVSGATRTPMRELIVLDGESLAEAHRLAVRFTQEAHFTDEAGNVVDWQKDPLGLTVQQWNWWKSRIWACARDEKISPEV